MVNDWQPNVQGTWRINKRLANLCWFGVGGPARYFFMPADIADLQRFLQQKPEDVPVMIMGVGSNLLVRDGGFDGVVIRLSNSFAQIEVKEQAIIAGALALDAHVANIAASSGLTGLEFLSGVPGTIGGAIAMNAGAYGREIKDVLLYAEGVDMQGELCVFNNQELSFSYRQHHLPEPIFFTKACLQAAAGDIAEIERRMAEIQQARQATQPIKSKTGGSTFMNPPGYKAWQLIDQAGCRGLRIGGAQVSEQHCNFLLNTGDATAHDIESLIEIVQQRVKESSGIDLHTEIKIIGEKI